MDELHATCPFCSHERPAEVVDICLLASGHPGGPARAIFDCPACLRTVTIRVDPETASMLRHLGARIVPGHPGPSVEPVLADAPAFTHDDLLDFHLLLQRTDWYERLRASV